MIEAINTYMILYCSTSITHHQCHISLKLYDYEKGVSVI